MKKQTPATSLKLLPLALAVQLGLAGAALAADKAKDGDQDVEKITVTASADASADGLIGAYAGGQVARGQKAGILGTTDYMDSPFSGTAYTNQFMKDIQAQGIGDVIQHDPGVRVARGFGNFQESYFIRGFLLFSDEMAYNGLYGVLPRQFVSSELIERVEVLRGASAFLNGMAPGGNGIGGSVNLLPKRASNDEKTDVTLGLNQEGQAYAAADLSRRFGDEGQHGLRLNLAHRDGETGVDNEEVQSDVLSLGYDWRGDRARVSADATYQERRLDAGRPAVTLGTGITGVPAVPGTDHNYAQDWTYSDEKDWFGTLRGEYDLSATTTAWAAVGARYSEEDNSLANITVNDLQSGEGTSYRADNVREDTVVSAELGLRGQLQTGSVKHNWVLSASHYGLDSDNAYAWSAYNGLSANLYRPVQLAAPVRDGFAGGNMDNPGLTQKVRLDSLAIADSLALWDDQLLLTLGGRFQQMKIDNFGYDGTPSPSYDKSRLSPSVGLVYKASDAVSFYANYIESLAQGETAGFGVTANVGEQLSPYVSKQKEVGVKYDGGDLGATLALFTTDKPSAFVDADGRFGEYGEDRHQGVELSWFGELTGDVKLLGGLTYLDAEQRDTKDGATDGNRVIGTAKWQGNLGLQWDLPWVYGLSLDAQMIATGDRYADANNSLKVAGWTRFDLGAKYGTTILNHDVTFYARVENLTDKAYWASVGGYSGYGYLVQGGPRVVSLSASLAF